MVYDETLAERVRQALIGSTDLTEKKMFGGIAFLHGGSMCVGVHGQDLIVRCEKDQTAELLTRTGVREFDLSGGRPMKGWLLVGPEATRTSAGLQKWIGFAREQAVKVRKTATGATKPRKKRR